MEFPNSFSEREKEVVDLLLQGKSNKQIAFGLGITNRTVEYHMGNIFAKLGVSSRSEAILAITSYNNHSSNGLGADGLRESTVVSTPEVVNNIEKSLRRIPMKRLKLIFASSGLLAGILIIYLAFPNIWGKGANINDGTRSPDAEVSYSPSPLSSQINANMLGETKSPETAVTSSPSPTPFQEQSLLNENKYTFTQTVDSVDVRLLINWFYIDESRVNLEVAICGIPMPDGFKPVYLIDPAKLALMYVDGSPIPLEQRDNSGSGGGGVEDQVSDEKESCYRQTFDYSLPESYEAISQDDTYTLDIPVGGTITGDTGEIKSLLSTTFHVQVNPTYSGSLTFATNKGAEIENKAVTFKGLEVNPSSAAVILCVNAPIGEQWIPDVEILYKGSIIYGFSGELMDGTNEDPATEMCYRLNYSYPFQIDANFSPQADLSILVAKLTTVQPERISYEVIAHAQNKLAEEGIEFSYVVISHGSYISITKKPEGLTEAEAVQKVQDFLTEKATPSDIIVFDLN